MINEYSWPQTCAYDAISNEAAHAVGALAINWNYAERSLTSVLIAYLSGVDYLKNLSMPEVKRSFMIVDRLDIEPRLDLLLQMAKDGERDSAVVQSVDFFAKAFKACRTNRNLVVHSVLFPDPTGELRISHVRPKGAKKMLPSTAIQIGEAAADCARVFHFGTTLAEHIAGRSSGRRVALPKPFAMPRKLTIPAPANQ